MAMRHSIITRKFINGSDWLVAVKLVPENKQESDALKNIEKNIASDSEKRMLNVYLQRYLDIGKYTLVKVLKRLKRKFLLHIYVG
jgi:hypothetical protein